MAQLPQKTGAGSLLDANTSVAQQQTNFGNMLQFLADLFGTGDSSSARATVVDTALGSGRTPAAIAPAAGSTTFDLAAAPADRIFNIAVSSTTGSAAIASLGTLPSGAERELRFITVAPDFALTFVNSGTLLCPGGQALRVYQGDVLKVTSLGSGAWRIRDITRTWGPDVDLVTWRNRLINGDMRIDQRNAGASVTPTATQYIVDRWRLAVTQASKITAGRNLGAVTPPGGYTNYLGFQTASAFASASTDSFAAEQPIEGVNVADLAWGTAAAQAVAVSFWYRSSLTGTHSASVRNGAGNRSYPFTFTVNAANTWEQKIVVIPGDTAGAWATDTSAGLILAVDLGSGVNSRGTAGAWAAANLVGVTGAVSMVGTLSATIQFTGAQVEVGGVATPFERREYSLELSRCRRYFEKSNDDGVVPGTVSTVSAYQSTSATSFILSSGTVRFAVSKRAAPTVTLYSPNSGATGSTAEYNAASVFVADRAATAFDIGGAGFVVQNSGTATPANNQRFHWTASSDL